MKKFKLCLALLISFLAIGYGQEEKCKCLTNNQVNICYLSVDEYCYNEGGCNHTLDGAFMDDYIALKLVNPDNFGIDGVSSCAMNLIKVKGPKTVKEINDQGCHVFLIGSFPIDTSIVPYQVNSDKSGVPVSVLKTIRQWSMECDNNLTIVSQAEAAVWGYTITNSNINPNTAITEPARFNLFSGPFGTLTQFLQGGSYQGVITESPSTGTLILAKDAKSKPTVAFDELTNDLILGDIGIICGLAGNLTRGPLIDPTNSNDVLAANMFALGCNISIGTKYSDESVFICPETTLQLPNGVIVDSTSLVSDTIQLDNGCDSIHIYKVFVYEKKDSTFTKDQCTGDKSQYVFNQLIFDESHPKGQSVLVDNKGCNYTVHVDLTYHLPTFQSINIESCISDQLTMKIGNDIYNFNHPSGTSILKDKYGCDSTIHVDIKYLRQDTTVLQYFRCRGDSVSYKEKFYAAGKHYTFVYDALNPCDSMVILALDTFPTALYHFPSPVIMHQYQPFLFHNTVDPSIKEINWSGVNGLSCYDCLNPTFDMKTYPSVFDVVMKDTNQCVYHSSIAAQYICAPLLPNVFAPLSGSGNQLVDFSTLCPINGFLVKIFDRWGNEVFQSEDPQISWDGKWNGQILNEGVYTYSYTIVQADGTKFTNYGNITLLR